MKKFYVYALALGLSTSALAQSTFDFESHTLNAESFDNGSAGNGDFMFSQSEEIGMYNYYDTQGMWWLGFSISNVTDNTTPGWGNQYSAYPGSGAGASSNYAVLYNGGDLYGTNPTTAITEFKITNATYAALSMKDGDAFGKQFGSLYNADGILDGTNGQDFFKVWMICESANGDKDSLDFYLADYRFADSTQDYIVDTWETIDLTGLSFFVNSVDFRFESSDMDSTMTWINTPGYLALDDVKTIHVLDVPEVTQLEVNVFPNPANEIVYVQGGTGVLSITDLSGKVVYKANHDEQSSIPLNNLAPSIYVIKVSGASGSYTNRLIVR